MKEAKTYPHIQQLKEQTIQLRLSDNVGYHELDLSANDPRRLASTIAPVPPPPTAQIVAEQKSRFKDSVWLQRKWNSANFLLFK